MIWWHLVFCSTMHLMPYWGTFCFGWDLWIFMEVACLSPLLSYGRGWPGLHSWWFGVTWLLDLPHIWCHTGAYSITVEIRRFSWSCAIIITYWSHTEMLTCSLPYHDTSVDPLWIHLVGPSFFDIWFPAWYLFRETFPRYMDLIYITEITCSMIDSLMSSDFRFVIHLMPY